MNEKGIKVSAGPILDLLVYAYPSSVFLKRRSMDTIGSNAAALGVFKIKIIRKLFGNLRVGDAYRLLIYNYSNYVYQCFYLILLKF